MVKLRLPQFSKRSLLLLIFRLAILQLLVTATIAGPKKMKQEDKIGSEGTSEQSIEQNWYEADSSFLLTQSSELNSAITTANLTVLAIYYSYIKKIHGSVSEVEKSALNSDMLWCRMILLDYSESILKEYQETRVLSSADFGLELQKELIDITTSNNINETNEELSDKQKEERTSKAKRVANEMLNTKYGLVQNINKLNQEEQEQEEEEISYRPWYNLDDFSITKNQEYNGIVRDTVFRVLAVYVSRLDENDQGTRKKKIQLRKKELFQLTKQLVNRHYGKLDIEKFKKEFYESCTKSMDDKINQENSEKDMDNSDGSKEFDDIREREKDMIGFELKAYPRTDSEADRLLASLRFRRDTLLYAQKLQDKIFPHVRAIFLSLLSDRASTVILNNIKQKYDDEIELMFDDFNSELLENTLKVESLAEIKSKLRDMILPIINRDRNENEKEVTALMLDRQLNMDLDKVTAKRKLRKQLTEDQKQAQEMAKKVQSKRQRKKSGKEKVAVGQGRDSTGCSSAVGAPFKAGHLPRPVQEYCSDLSRREVCVCISNTSSFSLRAQWT